MNQEDLVDFPTQIPRVFDYVIDNIRGTRDGREKNGEEEGSDERDNEEEEEEGDDKEEEEEGDSDGYVGGCHRASRSSRWTHLDMVPREGEHHRGTHLGPDQSGDAKQF